MKTCIHCNAILEDEHVLCPVCGADLSGTAAEEEPAFAGEEIESFEQPAEDLPEAPAEVPAEAPAEAPAPKKKNRIGLIVGLALVPDVRFKLDEQFDGDRIAAKKEEYQLLYFVNGVIDEVLASGEYMAWYEEAAERANALGL